MIAAVVGLLALTAPLYSFWQEGFVAANAKAQTDHKPVVAFFLASDCSEASKQFESKVLEDPLVQQKLGEYFSCTRLDYRTCKPISVQMLREYTLLKNWFQIDGFPMAVLIMPSGCFLSLNADFTTDPERFVNHLVEEYQKAQAFENVMRHFELMHFNDEQLKELYFQARKLGCAKSSERLLQAGVRTNRPLFFLKETYCQLAFQGAPEEEKSRVSQQLYQLGTSEREAARFIALVEFQVRTAAAAPLELQRQPLQEYLLHYGAEDPEREQIEQFCAAHAPEPSATPLETPGN